MTGASQPETALAAALPADPSRARPEVTIHHHGTEAPTAARAASKFRSVSFMVSLPCPNRTQSRPLTPDPSPPRGEGRKSQISRQVQKPTTKSADIQVSTLLTRVPRR